MNSYNKDELETPEWINLEFLQTILNHSNNSNNVKVSEYKIAPATLAGDHYASIMFRTNIKYQLGDKKDDISLIIKAMPQLEGQKKELFEVSNIFEVESTIYDKILPEMSILLKKADIEKPLAARIFYYSMTPRKIIVFEDLQKLGFVMPPKPIPIKADFKKIILRLAEFHAASYKMAADGNALITKFRNGSCFNMPQIFEMEFFKESFNQFKAFVSSKKEFKIYAKKLEPMIYEEIVSKCIKEVNTLGAYSVLNHGDFTIKNTMFKLNENKTASEVILVDFQLCHWGSPALDLSYAKMLNPVETRNELDKFYFNAFTDLLNKMKYTGKLPTFADLKSEVKRLRCVELISYILLFPFMSQESGKIDKDLNEFLASAENAGTLYTSKTFQMASRKILPMYLNEGLFDLWSER